MDGSDFEVAVRVVNDRLASSSPVFRRSGVAVRDQLVAPILNAVGWRTYDTSEVQPCETTDAGPYYYVLLQDGDPAVLVEAVDSGTCIGSPAAVRQLAALSQRVGAVCGLLTNGRTWVLVRSPQAVAGLSNRIEWWARIDDEPVVSFQDKLAAVSKENVLRQTAA
jgi:predicted type IV restriction endonuclease